MRQKSFTWLELNTLLKNKICVEWANLQFSELWSKFGKILKQSPPTSLKKQKQKRRKIEDKKEEIQKWHRDKQKERHEDLGMKQWKMERDRKRMPTDSLIKSGGKLPK